MGVTTYKRLAGPISIPAAATNIWNNGSGGLIYDIIKQIHISNRTSSPHQFSAYIGATSATAAGTDLFVNETCPANDVYEWYPANFKMISTDFLVMLADTVSCLSVTVIGEQYVV